MRPSLFRVSVLAFVAVFLYGGQGGAQAGQGLSGSHYNLNIIAVPPFLFDDAAVNYLWQYDNFGNRILKLRFYPISQPIGSIP